MGHIFKPVQTKPLPEGAKIVKVRGKHYGEWADSSGKLQRMLARQGRNGDWRGIQECSTYFARYKDAYGRSVTRTTGCKTMDAARQVLADFERKAEREKIGAVSPHERKIVDHGNGALSNHIDDYVAALTARGATLGHVENVNRFLDSMVLGCGWTALKDMNRSDFEKWIGRLRVEPRYEGGPTIGARSLNARIAAAKAFCNWLVQADRIAANPLGGVKPLNERADRRHERRPLTPAELSALIDGAARRPLADRLDKNRGDEQAELRKSTRQALETLGAMRALAYRTLAFTGLRFGELKSITVGQVKLDAKPPHIELRAKDEKARRGAYIPLRNDLAALLRQYLVDKLNAAQRAAQAASKPIPMALDLNAALFDVPKKMNRVFDRDLTFAGIAGRTRARCGHPFPSPHLRDHAGACRSSAATGTTTHEAFGSEVDGGCIHPLGCVGWRGGSGQDSRPSARGTREACAGRARRNFPGADYSGDYSGDQQSGSFPANP